MNYLGIDPGKLGGIVLIDKDEMVMSWRKMPMIGKDYDLGELDTIFKDAWAESNAQCKVFVETKVVTVKGKEGRTSLWTNGYGHGILHGLLTANLMGFELVTGAKWSAGIPGLSGLERDPRKKKLKHYAGQLCPTLPKNSGICDAYLIARYGRMKHLGMK